MHKLSPTKKLTLGAMVTALSVLSLYAASILPTGKLACYFVSSLFVYILTCEGAYVSAITAFLASVGVAFLMLPDRLSLLPYALLLGHYGIFKTFIDGRVKERAVRILLKMIYCNVFFAGAAAIAYFFIDVDFSSYLQIQLPLWVVIIILEAAFFLFDVLYTFCERIYDNNIRSAMVPKR